jgi:ribosomal protein L24
VKKHVRGQGERPGQIVSVEAGLHYSKVALADPVSGAPVRVARMFLDDGTKGSGESWGVGERKRDSDARGGVGEKGAEGDG